MKICLLKNKLYFDEEFFIDLNRDTIAEYNLRERDEISQEEYYELIRKRALSMAYYLLARKDFPKKKLKDLLISKYKEAEIIEDILISLEDFGYLDDEEYARIYIKNHNYSKRKMEYMLRTLGIDNEIISNLLENRDEKDKEQIIKLWQKMGDREERKKIASLMRRGYTYSLIKDAINELE